MNWRATHVLTAKRDLAIVPNSAIAKAKIINASSPSGIRWRRVAYLAAVFAIISYVLDLPGQGLLATSGAIAIVLGVGCKAR